MGTKSSNNWTREEHILAFNLYCKIPFSKINDKYSPVRQLASIIGRTEGAVAMKLANFARLDPALQARNVSGLKRGAKGEEVVWNEFIGNWEELAWESEKILAKYQHRSVEEITDITTYDLPKEGKERETIVKVRVNQSFFRKMILASYGEKCCITGLNSPGLLVASHIIPWSKGKEHRMKPENGLCLNAIHDKAFDSGLITVTPNLEIKYSGLLLDQLSDSQLDSVLKFYDRKTIELPSRFNPDRSFLEYHNQHIFKGT